ncbi:CotH kinase family protein [Chryseobacterium salipaludis]|uniref:CotH kinase family protein n=1 Tax=Chryseobacterium TaxID=59732 RepID=UPI001FF59407|nr:MULTISPECIES: CotH kinase family protein [Chryseobacterium]MCJ8497142.1 CotH kinase family protein [Chryseobacterium salipaludis]MCX3296624.1 CotH kinase family protein [Planobacterium sp. JC490]
MSQQKLVIPKEFYKVDVAKKMILSNYDLSSINGNSGINTITLDQDYAFKSPANNVEVGESYELFAIKNGNEYVLYFTELPIVTINTPSVIVDTPKVLAEFSLSETGKPEIKSKIGIEYRGASSQAYPKKSLEIEFWEDNDGTSTKDIPILGMMNHDSFNLQAMYSEDSRVRSKTGNDLWLQMSTLSYQEKEPEGKNGILGHFVEMFMNGEYYGVYNLSEKVNRKNLKLKKYKDGIRGELYKGKDWGGTTLYSYDTSFDNTSAMWSSFEFKHPKGYFDWQNLYNFVSFVVDADHTTFAQQIASKFEVDNAIDYYIFLNVLRAIDNTGKNLYIAKYDKNTKYFYVPWDLDAAFGYSWDSTQLNDYGGLLTNGLYDKLFKNTQTDIFRQQLGKRWQELRQTFITHENIMSLFNENHEYLVRNKVLEREAKAWDYTENPTALNYMSEWLQNRINYLDGQFGPMLATENISKATEKSIVYYPNPVKDQLSIVNKYGEKGIIKIYSATGQLVYLSYAFKGEETVDTSKLPDGIYFGKFETGDRSESFKIIVAK